MKTVEDFFLAVKAIADNNGFSSPKVNISMAADHTVYWGMFYKPNNELIGHCAFSPEEVVEKLTPKNITKSLEL